jgi:hypothetical protein
MKGFFFFFLNHMVFNRNINLVKLLLLSDTTALINANNKNQMEYYIIYLKLFSLHFQIIIVGLFHTII